MSEREDRAQTDFGYERVPLSDKPRRVDAVFSSVAPRYDLMNDLMSFGIHRLWKRFAVLHAGVRRGHVVLDLAGGTGDIAALLARKVGDEGSVVLADVNRPMLEAGRDRLIDAGFAARVRWAQASAEALPFAASSFDAVTIAFGLRNFADKSRALGEILRVLRPGGALSVLEFSRPVSPLLAGAYDRYSFSVLPRMGRLVTGDADSYRYLAESIRMHPDQRSLKTLMEASGFARVDYMNLSGGIVALHRGYKL